MQAMTEIEGGRSARHTKSHRATQTAPFHRLASKCLKSKSNIRIPSGGRLIPSTGESMRKGITVEVSEADRARLEAIAADRNSPQKHVWRARIVLLTADGLGTVEIRRQTGTSGSCGPGSRVCCAIKLGPRASRRCR